MERISSIATGRGFPCGRVTVSADLAVLREFWRDFPVYDFEKMRFDQLNYAQNGRVYAHQGPLCASARIFTEPRVSHSGIRTFSDFPINASETIEFENAARITTQAVTGQWEAATVSASVMLTGAKKYAHKRIMAV
jgi:hypothetical protein